MMSCDAPVWNLGVAARAEYFDMKQIAEKYGPESMDPQVYKL